MASCCQIDEFGPERGSVNSNDLLQLQTRIIDMNLSQLESDIIKINDFEGRKLDSRRL